MVYQEHFVVNTNGRFKTLTSSRSVQEAFMVFVALTLMAFLNTGQLWDQQNILKCCPEGDLIKILALREGQVQEIERIQGEYALERWMSGRIPPRSIRESKNDLLKQRNAQIMEVLSDHQKEVLRAYCSDLIVLMEYQ